LAPLIGVQHGVLYVIDRRDDGERFAAAAADAAPEHMDEMALAVGLVGQCARDRQRILMTDVPGSYIAITSGLGSAPPLSLALVPVLSENSTRAVLELASFRGFSDIHLTFLNQLAEVV